jgi:hypothetical protein
VKDESLLRSTVVVLSQRYAVSIPRMYALLRSRGEAGTLEYLEHRRNFYGCLLELEISAERPMSHAQALSWLENRGKRMDIDKERI